MFSYPKNELLSRANYLATENRFFLNIINEISSKSPFKLLDLQGPYLEDFKLNLLIWDLNCPVPEFILLRTKNLINLTANKLAAQEIRLSKPFKFSLLYSLISASNNKQTFFGFVTKDYLYNQDKAEVYHVDKELIQLSPIENDLLASVLQNTKRQIKKADIWQKLWPIYNKQQQKTLDTHLYNLKQKLPLLPYVVV